MFKRHHLSFIPASVIGRWLRVLVTLAGMSLLLVVLWEGKFSAARAGGNTVIASDSFNRTVSNGWGTADLGGSWTVLDSPANWSVAPGAGSISVGATASVPFKVRAAARCLCAPSAVMAPTWEAT
jgi:hypothetical protein